MSFKGNQYLFVAYLYSHNAIIVCPMKSRKDEDMITAFQDDIEYLESRDAKPLLDMMDNESSKKVNSYPVMDAYMCPLETSFTEKHVAPWFFDLRPCWRY